MKQDLQIFSLKLRYISLKDGEVGLSATIQLNCVSDDDRTHGENINANHVLRNQGNLTDFMQCGTAFTQWKVSAEAAKQQSTLTHTQPEAVEGMSVDAVQLPSQSDSKFHHNPYLGLLPLSVLEERSI